MDFLSQHQRSKNIAPAIDQNYAIKDINTNEYLYPESSYDLIIPVIRQEVRDYVERNFEQINKFSKLSSIRNNYKKARSLFKISDGLRIWDIKKDIEIYDLNSFVRHKFIENFLAAKLGLYAKYYPYYNQFKDVANNYVLIFTSSADKQRLIDNLGITYTSNEIFGANSTLLHNALFITEDQVNFIKLIEPDCIFTEINFNNIRKNLRLLGL